MRPNVWCNDSVGVKSWCQTDFNKKMQIKPFPNAVSGYKAEFQRLLPFNLRYKCQLSCYFNLPYFSTQMSGTLEMLETRNN